MAGWYQLYNGLVFEQTLGENERQGVLLSYSPWSYKRVVDNLVTEQQQSKSLVLLLKITLKYI